jgi:hypothetical protein
MSRPLRGHGSELAEEALLDEILRLRAMDAAPFALKSPFFLGRVGRPLVLAVMIGGLTGCSMFEPPSSPDQTQQIAVVPEPPAAERPPVPRRKPPTPGAAITAPQGPDAAPVDAGTAAETHVATLEPSPSTPVRPSPERPGDVPSDLIGMESSAIERSLGPPGQRRDVPPAVVWQYASDACDLDVWLYRDLQSGALRALFVEVKGDDRTDQRRQYCIKQLALQSAGGSRRFGADAAAPR